mmetsp:Transcript_21176/g.50184  ORF Transcript_21176/g.50184 Transcript_21176/m.50184 type:complete len:542 (-) Transcript_21176:39-1664(-)
MSGRTSSGQPPAAVLGAPPPACSRGDAGEPNDLPPHPADDGPDEEGGAAADGTEAHRRGHVVEARGVVERGLGGGVVGERALQVGVECEREHGKHRRHPGGDHHAEEGRAERGDVRRLRGEEVVHGHVDAVQQPEGGRPRQLRGVELRLGKVAQRADEAARAEGAGHADERAEEEERVPRAAHLRALGPGGDSQSDLSREADHRGGRRGHADLLAEDPEQHRAQHRADHEPLVAGERPQRRETVARVLARAGRRLDRGRVEVVHESGHHEHAGRGRHARGEQPRAEGAGHGVAHLRRDLHAEQVLRGRGHRRRRRVHRGLQVALREEAAQPAGGDARRVLVERVRVRLRRERVDERHVDRGARRGRGHRRCDERLREREAVAEAERGAAELGDKEGGDAVAQARRDEAAREEHGEHDEPDDLVRERAEGLLERERLRDHRRRERQEAHAASRERLEDETRDRRDEDGEQAHRTRCGSGRRRKRAHREPDADCCCERAWVRRAARGHRTSTILRSDERAPLHQRRRRSTVRRCGRCRRKAGG